ncbi:MAG: putative Ig domain-containing protein [Candidatus Acidiferrales bacterium]
MKSRVGVRYLLAFLILGLFQFAACTGTPSTFNAVSISPSGTVFIGQGAILSISASVLNDAAKNGGVTFTASPTGTGTLTQTSSATATYAAPGTVTTQTVVTITATSVDFPKQSAKLAIKVEPPPMITTTSLPTATLNQAYTGPVTATGGIPPLSWKIASGTLPAGLSLAASTSDTVNITGTPTAGGTSTITIAVTDSTGASSTSRPLTIVVSSLGFTTTSPLPPATTGIAYSDTFAATGGTPPYTFSVATGSSLPTGFTLDPSSGTLSNSNPTTQGTFMFGITVTDSATPTAASITQTFTLVIAGPQNLNLLSGNYAFTFAAFNTHGYVAAAGTFAANGNGSITGGEFDYNSVQGPPKNYSNLMGTYTLGTDGRGTITFTNSSAGTFSPAPTYAFAIDPAGSGHGRIIEFDTTGTRGSGRLETQTVTACTVGTTGTTYVGNFAFGGSGFTNSTTTGAGPIAFAGEFVAAAPTVTGTPGSVGPGETDANLAGTIASFQTLTGTYQSASDSTHCTFSLTPQFATGPLAFSAYPVSATEAFLVETDQITSTGSTPYISVLDLLVQTGFPFQTQNTISGAMAGGLTGAFLSGSNYLPEAAVAQVSVANSGAGNFDFLFTDNQAGTVTSNMATASSAANPTAVTFSSDQYGRIVTGNITTPYYQPVLYLVSTSEAFIVTAGVQPGQPVLVGHLAPQSAGPFSPATISGTLVEGTAAPATDATRNFSGFFTLSGSVTPATVSGTQDESTTAANIFAENVAGTYSVIDTANGTGAFTLTAPAAFSGVLVILSPTQFAIVSTTADDANPVLIVAGP